ncbi:sensor histidine kinase [Nodosilinea sp. E11]|uniref:sensor histidine kinase n=1 Tax=Nodosilinea sp. E11 TaxID=3037479 RepID=UPI0029347D5A|nr:PAS domain-containing protein [Nodosilinea sp. E11]WOD40180.1 PAS domain-containing protein [Nodosilinea sp. E11]
MANFQSHRLLADASPPSLSELSDHQHPLVVLVVTQHPDRTRLSGQSDEVASVYPVLEAKTLPQGLALWQHGGADGILLDLTWPSDGALDFLTTLGKSQAQRPLPVVVLVEPGQERSALEAMKLGAADYIYRAELTPQALWSSLELSLKTRLEQETLSLRLSLALESGQIGSWERDLSTDNIIWDQCLIDLYGFARLGRSATYQDWCTHVHPDDLQRVEAGHQALLDSDRVYDIEFRIWRGDGSLGWIHSSALVRRDAQGQPLSIIGINYDITDRKLAEQQMLRTTAQLEASNRELEAFAYSVSHDLRAPLRAIDGFSLALIEDFGDQFGPEGRDYFDRIRYNVNRMGGLIEDLLRLSRLSRSAMVYAPVNLSRLVQSQVQDLQATAPDRQVAVAIAPDLVVSADPTLMGMAIANLVENAWKFTAHHPTARLEFGVVNQAGEPVYYLRDDGAGFDMAYADKLFGVFQRLHNTDEFPGTGIGLATVQRVIGRHGGRVWAQAAVEQGATFYFTLPQIASPLENWP